MDLGLGAMEVLSGAPAALPQPLRPALKWRWWCAVAHAAALCGVPSPHTLSRTPWCAVGLLLLAGALRSVACASTGCDVCCRHRLGRLLQPTCAFPTTSTPQPLTRPSWRTHGPPSSLPAPTCRPLSRLAHRTRNESSTRRSCGRPRRPTGAQRVEPGTLETAGSPAAARVVESFRTHPCAPRFLWFAPAAPA